MGRRLSESEFKSYIRRVASANISLQCHIQLTTSASKMVNNLNDLTDEQAQEHIQAHMQALVQLQAHREAVKKREEEAKAKRQADEEAERKRKADEEAERKRKADEERQEKFARKQADKAAKERKQDVDKQESATRQLRGKTTTTTGPGAKKAEVSGKKRKRTESEDDEDDSAGSVGAYVASENDCRECVERRRSCKWGAKGKTCLECRRLHLRCELPGTEDTEKGKGKAGVKKPRIGVATKESEDCRDGIKQISEALTEGSRIIGAGFAGLTAAVDRTTAAMEEHTRYLKAIYGEVYNTRRYLAEASQEDRHWKDEIHQALREMGVRDLVESIHALFAGTAMGMWAEAAGSGERIPEEAREEHGGDNE
jgi:hypothetical protein